MVVPYELPDRWLKYDRWAIADALADAKAAILAMSTMPYQRAWAERLQEIELKREVAGTSRIEGAAFTERELELAISARADVTDLTRSQRQARAAMQAYQWLGAYPSDRKIDLDLVKEIHRRMVTGCDDDRCPPGEFRGGGQNVTFGRPPHRGVEGGPECEKSLRRLLESVETEFKAHDPLVQALALHYHFAAMHPFLDGNGRTARALEALMLRRAQLKDTLFIAMSNYYYDEKTNYLTAMSQVRQGQFDLTPFLKFALAGIASQTKRLLGEIRAHVQKSLFREVMGRLFGRLHSTRKRALASRQVKILERLLELEAPIEFQDLHALVERDYAGLKSPWRAFARDIVGLIEIEAVTGKREGPDNTPRLMIWVRLEWATEITDTEFYKNIGKLSQAKTRFVLGR